MNRFRAALIAATLALTLAFAAAPAVHAAPRVGPRVLSCTQVVTNYYGGVSSMNGINNQTFIQFHYDATTGAWCGDYRGGLKMWTSSGTYTITHRAIELEHSSTSAQLSGSFATSGTVFTQGTTPTYFYGPYVGGFPCGWQIRAYGWTNGNGGALSGNFTIPC